MEYNRNMRTLTVAAFIFASLASIVTLTGCVEMLPAVRATKTPLFLAAVSQNRDRIFPLLAVDPNLQVRGNQGRELVLAILEKRKADALRLVESGADANAAIIKSESNLFNSYNALMLAAWADDEPLVKALAAKGADLNDSANRGILAVVTKAPMFELLVGLGVPFDKEMGSKLLANFAMQGNSGLVRLLISRGADVETARAVFEKSTANLQSPGNSDIVNDPRIQEIIRKNNTAIQLLERMSQAPVAAAAPVSGGVTKAELAQMMKEAAAETAKAAPAPTAPAVPAAVVYKSDVDAPAYKVSENPDAYALVIGVEKYNTLPDARFAERDAKAMNAHLLAMGYPQRNIVLLTGTQATRTGLAKNLEAWLPNNVTERSTVLFYFSGHGAPDAKTSQAYLVPMDGDPQYLEETAYPIKRLYAKLAALKAKRVLVALDSCFSGAGGRSVLASGTRPLVAKMDLGPGEGKVVSLSASSSDEITGALEDQGHGLFTYNLLKALTETAGRGTVSEVYAALKPRVQDEARRQNRAQTPQVFGQSLDGGLR